VLLHMLGAVLITAYTARLVWSVRGPASELPLDDTAVLRTAPHPGAVPPVR
jgi:heme a synthase